MEATQVRLTPEIVLKAYEDTGLKPATGSFFPDTGCACGLGVYAYTIEQEVQKEVHQDFLDEAGDIADDVTGTIFPDGYPRGFANAFDGLDADTKYYTTDPEKIKNYHMGYEDGLKVVAALRKKYTFE